MIKEATVFILIIIMAFVITYFSSPKKSTIDPLKTYLLLQGVPQNLLTEKEEFVSTNLNSIINANNHEPNMKIGLSFSPNAFIVLSPEQFIKGYTGLKYPKYAPHALDNNNMNIVNGKNSLIAKIDFDKIPNPPNYLDYNLYKNRLLLPPRNQSNCGSCWAFAASSTIEAQITKLGINPLYISTQQFVDCVPEADGCDGGYPVYAYMWATQKGGVWVESVYTYNAKTNKCEYNVYKKGESSTDKGLSETGLIPLKTLGTVGVLLEQGDAYYIPVDEIDQTIKYRSLGLVVPSKETVTKIKKLLYHVGPLTCAIHVEPPNTGSNINSSFAYYSTGVFTLPFGEINHAVTLIGFGQDQYDNEYWIIRNSWGEQSWGIDGNALISINSPIAGLSGIVLSNPPPVKL